jgi:hypothetical protein
VPFQPSKSVGQRENIENRGKMKKLRPKNKKKTKIDMRKNADFIHVSNWIKKLNMAVFFVNA